MTSSLQLARVQFPRIMLTPDGRVDFDYIFSRLVTSRVYSPSEVGRVPADCPPF